MGAKRQQREREIGGFKIEILGAPTHYAVWIDGNMHIENLKTLRSAWNYAIGYTKRHIK